MKDPKKPESGSESMQSRIRRGRKFTLAEAVGREAAGSLSGASPVARAKQVLLEIEHFLESHLEDPAGSLAKTILARLENDLPLLARHFDRPAGALEEFLTVVEGEAAADRAGQLEPVRLDGLGREGHAAGRAEARRLRVAAVTLGADKAELARVPDDL